MSNGNQPSRPAPSLTSILNSFQLFCLILGGIWWLSTFYFSSENTKQRLTDFQATVSTDLKDIKTSTENGLSRLQTQISAFSAQAAQLDFEARRNVEQSGQLAAQELRIRALEDRVTRVESNTAAPTISRQPIPLPSSR